MALVEQRDPSQWFFAPARVRFLAEIRSQGERSAKFARDPPPSPLGLSLLGLESACPALEVRLIPHRSPLVRLHPRRRGIPDDVRSSYTIGFPYHAIVRAIGTRDLSIWLILTGSWLIYQNLEISRAIAPERSLDRSSLVLRGLFCSAKSAGPSGKNGL